MGVGGMIPILETVPAPVQSPIRVFANSGIQAAVERALSALPDGKTGAVVAVADMSGLRLATMARLGARWSVVMVGERKWTGQLSAEAAGGLLVVGPAAHAVKVADPPK